MQNNCSLRFVFNDLFTGLMQWRIWLLLGWHDIRLRYRRSTLGPFWITLSMAIMIYSMGFLYAHLFLVGLRNYFPILASGILIWNLITSIAREGNQAFILSAETLKQLKIPYSVFVLRVLVRNIIIFFHNFVAIIPIFIFFKVHFSLFTLLTPISLFLILLNGYFYGMILAILGARYRDTLEIVNSLIQVAFFLTPVMWSASALPGKYHWAILFNPCAQFVELFRLAILGQKIPHSTWLMVLFVTVLGFILMIFILKKCLKKIIHWV